MNPMDHKKNRFFWKRFSFGGVVNFLIFYDLRAADIVFVKQLHVVDSSRCIKLHFDVGIGNGTLSLDELTISV
jgi:hypothetical protein